MSTKSLTVAVAALTAVTAVNSLATLVDNRIRFRQRQNQQRVQITKMHDDVLRDLAANPHLDLRDADEAPEMRSKLLYANRWMSMWSLMHHVGFTSSAAIRATAKGFMADRVARDYWLLNRESWRKIILDEIDARFFAIVDDAYEESLETLGSAPATVADRADRAA